MGQFPDGYEVDLNKFEYFNDNKGRHLCDIEGDWLNRERPDIPNMTINGAPLGMKGNLFIRPTFSTLFVSMMQRQDKFDLPGNKSFGFQGYPDPFGLRVRLRDLVKRFPNEYNLTTKWNGLTDSKETHQSYEDMMKRHVFHLCPRGCGHDSVRFFECCFYGRIPIIVGDNYLFGELEGVDLSFVYRVTQYSPEQIQSVLKQVYELSWEEIEKKSRAARNYFDTYVRAYMKDPTAYYLNLYKDTNGLPIRQS
jgi:hypothetical protein